MEQNPSLAWTTPTDGARQVHPVAGIAAQAMRHWQPGCLRYPTFVQAARSGLASLQATPGRPRRGLESVRHCTRIALCSAMAGLIRTRCDAVVRVRRNRCWLKLSLRFFSLLELLLLLALSLFELVIGLGHGRPFGLLGSHLTTWCTWRLLSMPARGHPGPQHGHLRGRRDRGPGAPATMEL